MLQIYGSVFISMALNTDYRANVSNKPCVTDGAQRACLQMSCQCRMESSQPEGVDFPCVLTLNNKPSTGLKRRKKTITSRYKKAHTCVHFVSLLLTSPRQTAIVPHCLQPRVSTLERVTTCGPDSVIINFPPRSHLLMIQTS